LAPRPDGPLTHFASPRGEICRLVIDQRPRAVAKKKPRAGPPLLDSGYEESRGRKPSSRRE
ncbi:MAG: hypothetical protein OXI93_21930, partial [Bryobacterales bacterium]|nr:hypothetical protein [Bryobacterales bacterium]